MELNRGCDEEMPDTLRFQSWSNINRLYIDTRPEASAEVRKYYGTSTSLRDKISDRVKNILAYARKILT